jgi:hypothetical protein
MKLNTYVTFNKELYLKFLLVRGYVTGKYTK